MTCSLTRTSSRLREQQEAVARFDGVSDDDESMALAIRLQQDDDEAALRDALGMQEGEHRGSPSQYSYEQLMLLSEVIPEVNRGASIEDISALRTMSYEEARADQRLVLGDQCSICRMEWEAGDTLRVMHCWHAEHADCLDQWLGVKKCCPICAAEVTPEPLSKCAAAASIAAPLAAPSPEKSIQSMTSPASGARPLGEANC